MTRWRTLAAAAALCVLATFLSAVPAFAGSAPGLCTINNSSMNASRGAVPAKFPIEACVDGSNVYLYNSTTLVLSVGTEGSAGQPTTTPTNYTFGVEAARLKHGGEWVLMPGDKMRIPIGSASAGVKVELDTSAERYYALANTVATFIPDGKLLDSVNVFADFIATVNADFIDYQNCLAGRNYLGRAGCLARFSGAIGIAVKDLGLGLAAHVVSAILGVLLAAKTFTKWLDVQVPQVKSLINPPAILQAAVSGTSPLPTPTSSSPAGTGKWTAAEIAPAAETLPGGFAYISGAACSADAQCTAVGTEIYADSIDQMAVIVTQDGSTWQTVNAPLPADAGTVTTSQLVSVSCAPDGSCAAVGDYTDNSGQHGLLVTGQGSDWSATEAPLPANATGQDVFVTSAACPADGQCVAVGEYADTDDNSYRGLLLTLSGGTWQAAQAPEPQGGGSGVLNQVACQGAGECSADGTYADGDQQGTILMLSQSGGSWHATGVAPPAGASRGLDGIGTNLVANGIACGSSGCAAVGNYPLASGSGFYGYAVSGSGTSWSASQVPDSYSFNAVACQPGSASCDAVTSETGSGAGVVYGSGSAWNETTVQPPASAPAGDKLGLVSIACPQAQECVAAGSAAGYGPEQPALATGSDGTWASALAPVPAGDSANLEALACSSATHCVAFGQYETPASTTWTGILVEQGPA